VAFLLRRPRLLAWALGPGLLAFALALAGLVLGLFVAPGADATLGASHHGVPEALAIALTLALWLGLMVGGGVLGLAVAMLLAAPVLARLSRRAENLARGRDAASNWQVLASLRGTLPLVATAPGAIVVGVLPLVGPLAGVLWGAHFLAHQQTDTALARHGRSAPARKNWHREWWAESLGFGLAGLVTLAVPLVQFLAAPAVAVGATLLVLELEQLSATVPTPAAAAEAN
jgi:uncharacterized protein involved in cysteine biosynthesis